MGARVVTMKPGELEALLEARVAEVRSRKRETRSPGSSGTRASRRGLYGGLASAAVVVFVLFVGAVDTFGGHDQPPLPLTSPLTGPLEAPECVEEDQEVADLGLPSAQISGDDNRAHEGTNGPIVVWANATTHNDLTTLNFSTSETIVNGQIVSRSHLNIAGSNNQFRHGTEYGTAFVANEEAFHLSGQNNCFSGDPAVAQVGRPTPTQPEGFPVDFDPDDDGFLDDYAPDTQVAEDAADEGEYFVCRPHTLPEDSVLPTDPAGTQEAVGCLESGKMSVSAGTTIPTGLYWIPGSETNPDLGIVDISQSGLVISEVTIVSGGDQKIQGSSQAQFIPYIHNLLFLGENGTPNSISDGQDAVFVSGSVSFFRGIIHAPNGRVTLSGSQLSFTCPIYGDRVGFAGGLIYVDNEDCDDSNLTPDKENDVGGATTLGNPWTWTITVNNDGDAGAAFADGAVILTDNLPDGDVTYSAFSGPDNESGITGTIDCSLTGVDISCVADGPVSIAADGSFEVSVLATPLDVGTFDNPEGICEVDPDNVVTESNENDNTCSDSVTVTAPNLTSTKANNVGGATTLGTPWTWTITASNVGNAAAVFADGEEIVGDPLPSGNITYGTPSVLNATGVTNAASISCAITADVLSCVADGAAVTMAATTGSFQVAFSATPSATGTFNNSSNLCVDPDNEIVESNELDNTCSDSVTVTEVPSGALFIVIDEDSIDNNMFYFLNPVIGQQNIFPSPLDSRQAKFTDTGVNDQLATYGFRAPLPFFQAHINETVSLFTGSVGDEAWFAPNCIPQKWINGKSNTCLTGDAFQTGLNNYMAGSVPQNRLDKMPAVRALRALGLVELIGSDVCAVVYDSDISSMEYLSRDPWTRASLQGANYGIVAFHVIDVVKLNQFSSGSLPEIQLRILDPSTVCGPTELHDAPIPRSSSEPYDIDPAVIPSSGYRNRDASGNPITPT
jgi:hypothetical protein